MKYNVFMVLIGYTYDLIRWREKSHKCASDALKKRVPLRRLLVV